MIQHDSVSVLAALKKFVRRHVMQYEGSYDDLVRALISETRQSIPPNTLRVDSYGELLALTRPLNKSLLFLVSAEPQAVDRGSPGAGHSIYGTARPIDNAEEDRWSKVELDVSVLSGHLEQYFSWFGEIDMVYLLGSSVAVFRMKHSFSVSHILKCSTHDISIPEVVVESPPASNLSILNPAPMRSVQAAFTVYAFENEALSLNTILAILKYVDPASVVMVRRVNRLGFDGKGLVKKYFEAYGKVLRVFMLPLRSRKKSASLPSKTGFVVMDSVVSCKDILKQEDHMVLPGLFVSVGKFTHRSLSAMDC